MRKIFNFLSRNDQVIIIIVIVIAIVVFVHLKTTDVKEDGIITIAKVVRYESAASGSSLYIEIYLNDKKVVTTVGQDCQGQCIGKFFFVKVLKNNPKKYPIFYGDKPVPDCIVANVKQFKGWTYIPNCENY